ncbi:polysaccharide biosynthesis tyrosine autokinase [Pricia sp. S334]|uniref:non-specific protein-tyrosine kinase n=1 Tax=Pricia mediterranea TaxID=3076079 RepID=A0ABU3L3T1_9FLAO|nr:polysaccharide biosynthesis tyrosine autokinase [Pricia sp. S334]MDT7828092.1 polysaccharide biosynthesis tyrosine autokinase [Pricia sp. S334]
MSYTKKSTKNEDLFTSLVDLFFPFWPLLAILLLASFALAWGYKKYRTPTYGISATLIIKDENKGVDDSKMVESMNPFDSKKIVENEIKVLQSPDLMKKVVDTLNLYAPVYEKTTFFGLSIKSVSAYSSSPILVQIERPEKIVVPEDGPAKHYFNYDSSKKTLTVDGKAYPIDRWVHSPFGEVRFIENSHKVRPADSDLYFELVNPRSVTEAMLQSFEVIPPEKLSTVVNLFYEDAVPSRGEDVLNGLIKAYNQKDIQERNRLAANTMKFIEDRIKNVEGELNVLEGEIEKYRSDRGAVDLSEQGRLYLQDAGETDQKIADINLQLSILEKVENYIQSKDTEGSLVPSTLGIDDSVLTQLLQKLYDAEIRYERLKSTTGANNPLLSSLRDEINKIRPSILENVQSQKTNLQASLSNLSSTSGRYSSALKTIPEQERKLLEISRRKAVKNDLFAFLLQKREEMALSYVPGNSDNNVVTKAQASLKPISPKGFEIYGIAFFLAVGVWVGYVVIKEMMNNKILFRSEIEENTDLPVIGELSYVENDRQLSFKKPEDQVLIEQLRQLDANLGLYHRTFKKKKILVTSTLTGEGKSFVSQNLAYSLARSGKNVVLVDMDFRKPNTSETYGLLKNDGIVQFLGETAQFEDIVTPTELDENLFVTPAGTQGGDHTELLLNGRLELLFGELSERFDYIIMDSAPISLVSEGNLFAQFSDITLFVVRHAITPKRVVQRLGQKQTDKSLEHAAIVFNGLKKRGFVKETSGYGYGYGYKFDSSYYTAHK